MDKSFVPAVFLSLVSIVFPILGSAEPPTEGKRLWREGWDLHKSKRSNDDLKEAVRKYQEALKIFERQSLVREGTNRRRKMGNILDKSHRLESEK